MDAVEYDKKRTAYLVAQGYKVLRFWNNEVSLNIPGVLETVLSTLESMPSENILIPCAAGDTVAPSQSGQFVMNETSYDA